MGMCYAMVCVDARCINNSVISILSVCRCVSECVLITCGIPFSLTQLTGSGSDTARATAFELSFCFCGAGTPLCFLFVLASRSQLHLCSFGPQAHLDNNATIVTMEICPFSDAVSMVT